MSVRHLIGAVPAVGMLAGVWFANRTEPYVFGLPFFLFWLVCWVVLTSVAMAVVYRTDPANRRDQK